ncbi:MAG TPA: hypothetical protein VNU19_22550, partial [Candidatus Acidoferrum sp.]|nr:hypothetical protein [Candidatus Acidoferrum sp.]
WEALRGEVSILASLAVQSDLASLRMSRQSIAYALRMIAEINDQREKGMNDVAQIRDHASAREDRNVAAEAMISDIHSLTARMRRELGFDAIDEPQRKVSRMQRIRRATVQFGSRDESRPELSGVPH